MQFEPPLIPARLVRRYKRFLADMMIEETGEVVTVHCPNPGAMLGLLEDNAECWLWDSRNPKRKLRYTWRLVRAEGALVGIDTGLPNGLAEAGIRAGVVPELAGYQDLRREVKYDENSRIDLLLEDPARPPCYVEIKNVHLKRGPLAAFPDCVTTRGAKHLGALARMVGAGCRAVMLYVVQRGDCCAFTLADDLDPGYATAFRAARAAGVEVLCHSCTIDPDAIELGPALPIDIPAG